jgi:hypothetical protein
MADSGIGSRVLGNWQINSIVLLRSGQPYTPTMNVDVANIGNTTTRPDLVPILIVAIRRDAIDKTRCSLLT